MEIVGRLTKDAKVETLKSEKQVVNFSIAINDSYKPKGSDEFVKITTYVNCSYWINPGIAQYLTKGTLVELSGRIGVNAYKDMQDEAKASLTFHVNTIKLHGKPKSGNDETVSENSNKNNQPVNAGEVTEPLDDLPF
jgi:single-strand DNA-binding protein